MDRSQVFKVVSSNIEEIIDNSKGVDIQETHSMRDLGADSLEIIEVVSRSMKQLKIKVPRTELADLNNIGDLVSIFEKYAQQGSQNAS